MRKAIKNLTLEEFCEKEKKMHDDAMKLDNKAFKFADNFTKELLKRNGYKIGKKISCVINGKTEEGIVEGVYRNYDGSVKGFMKGLPEFWVRFKKVKDDGRPGQFNENMGFREEFKLN